MYAPDEAAIVRFAQASTRMAPISDEMFTEMRAHFDTQQMIELCFTVGNSGIINRFHALFHTELDADTVAAEILSQDLEFTANGTAIVMKSATGRSLRLVATDVGESGVELDKDES